MPVTQSQVQQCLRAIPLPGGGDLIQRDMVRALQIDGDQVSFVIEVRDAAEAKVLAGIEARAQAALMQLPGVAKVNIAMTAHQAPQAPKLKMGQHPTGGAAPIRPANIGRLLAIGSGKGGVGKSTVTSNLAVALARAGRRVGVLDADIHGPSQPHMMGVSARAQTAPDGKTIVPLQAHGVTLMSIGAMVDPGKAVIWRGPMLMGALQQMMSQVDWGPLDVLLVDLPPGTGDVQLTLSQRAQVDGALIVSTPQDVALLDAIKAIDMFKTLKTPVLGLIENMSTFVCPTCHTETHLFGHGGVSAAAERLGLPFLQSLPLDLETRLAGDAGTPIAASDGPAAAPYLRLADRLIAGGMA